MEHLDASPIDIRRLGQGFEELKLSRPSGGDNAGVLASMNRPADARRCLFGSDHRQSIFIIEYFHSERFVFCSISHFSFWFARSHVCGLSEHIRLIEPLRTLLLHWP